MKILVIVLAFLVGGVLLVEVTLRVFWGLGNPPLYIIDEEIGYLLKSNQNLRRFGNQIIINQYSMRTTDILLNRPNATLRVFLLGDSIANGGWWTDQNQTISALIENQLQSSLTANSLFKQVEVLNASANSWGPRNELAYLKRFGLFESQVIILLLNMDDLFAKAPASAVVGNDRNYPDQKPPLALVELYHYFFGKYSVKEVEEKGDRVGFNLKAIEEIQEIASGSNCNLIVAMTPLLRELEEGSRNYEQKARQRLVAHLEHKSIIYVDFLEIFKQVESPNSLYRDHIHLSPQGNQLVSNTIGELIITEIGK